MPKLLTRNVILNSIWTSIAIAAVLAIIAMMRGKFTSVVWISLILYVMIAAVFPAFGAMFGATALVVVLLKNGQQLAAQINQLINTGAGSHHHTPHNPRPPAPSLPPIPPPPPKKHHRA